MTASHQTAKRTANRQAQKTASLGVGPSAAVVATLGVEQFIEFQCFAHPIQGGLHVDTGVGRIPEVVELLPVVLRGLRHVELAVPT